MKHAAFLLLCLWAFACTAAAQTATNPPTLFRILYLDRPFTEEEDKAIEEGKMSRVVNLEYTSPVPGVPGKEEKTTVFITRNQVSPPQTYTGPGPIRLQHAAPPNQTVATIPTPKNGGDLLVVLKPARTGDLANASAQIIGSGLKELPPGNICMVNSTGLRIAFRANKTQATINPDKQYVFSPERLRMNAVALAVTADTKPVPRYIFEGALRLGPEDRVMFIAYSPPGSPDVFKTDFFMLQPSLSPTVP